MFQAAYAILHTNAATFYLPRSFTITRRKPSAKGDFIMTDARQRAAAKKFADDWKDKGYEKGHSHSFWLALLRDVYGVESPEQFIQFEEQVVIDNTSFIDAKTPTTKVLIH